METKLHSFRSVVVLLFVSGVLLLSGLDKLPVNIMEARNFISAREMVQNQEYLLPTLNNEPRYEKPPLPTWLTAISGTVFGFDSLYAMRLPVVAIALLLVFVFYYHSKLMGLGEEHALNNGLILISSFYIFYAGRDNQWDMYTHSFMMASIFFLWKLFQEDTKQVQNALWSGLFMGFSILSKGPVSFYALFLPFLISYGVVYRIHFRRKWVYFVGMLFAALFVGASWYIYVRLKDPVAFQGVASRETANWTSYEVKPFYYYWSFFLQSGLWAIPSLLALIYPYLKSRVSNLKAYQFAILWTLLALVFLSVVPEKKVRYLVPVLIPLALTTGFYIEYLIHSFKNRMLKWEHNVACFFTEIIALVGFAYPFALAFILKEIIMEHLFIAVFSSLMTIGCAVLIVRWLMQKDFRKVFYSMVALFTVGVFALGYLAKEFVYNPDYASSKETQRFETQYDVKTYSLSAVAPEIIWDFGKPIPVLLSNKNQVLLPVENRFGLLIDMKDSATVTKQFEQYHIKKLYRINLNYAKSLKDRLVKDYYLFSKVYE